MEVVGQAAASAAVSACTIASRLSVGHSAPWRRRTPHGSRCTPLHSSFSARSAASHGALGCRTRWCAGSQLAGWWRRRRSDGGAPLQRMAAGYADREDGRHRQCTSHKGNEWGLFLGRGRRPQGFGNPDHHREGSLCGLAQARSSPRAARRGVARAQERCVEVGATLPRGVVSPSWAILATAQPRGPSAEVMVNFDEASSRQHDVLVDEWGVAYDARGARSSRPHVPRS